MLLLVMMIGVCTLAFYIYYDLWLQPEKLRRMLMRQGIRGPEPTFFYGNFQEMKRIQLSQKPMLADKKGVISHEFKLFPHFNLWKKDYGSNFAFLTGNFLKVYVSEPELVKEIISHKSLDLGRSTIMNKNRVALFGDSVATANGDAWTHQRKIIAPEFFMDKVKGMVDLMLESTSHLIESWEARVKLEGGIADIKIDENLRNLSADILSRTCFGSSYSKGKEIFSKINALQAAIAANGSYDGIPGYRFFPSKSNREIWRMHKETDALILKVIKERRELARDNEKDLLNTILGSHGRAGSQASDRFLVDNCKSMYFAGHETTATTARWAMLLLALHPEWQVRARAEVAEVCGSSRLPDCDMLRRMKVLTMVIQETLRLYVTAPILYRETLRDIKFRGILLPKGITIFIPMAILHQDTDLWGLDAKEFNPERFGDGVSKACKIPKLYMPFGFGPRICLGQDFAMTELKIILSLILSKFCFKVSPTYRHSIVSNLVMEAEFGVNLLLQHA